MEAYDKHFAARLSRIAMRVAFTGKIPKITKIMAESWKVLDDKDLEDENMVEDAFTKLFNYHSDLAKAETEANLNKKMEEEIEDLVQEVKFWKEKRKPFQKGNDDRSRINRKTYNDKIDNIEQAIKRKKKKIVPKAQVSGIDRGIDLLDKSIQEFILKLYEKDWSYARVKQIVHQAMFNSGYGYSQAADISRWLVKRGG